MKTAIISLAPAPSPELTYVLDTGYFRFEIDGLPCLVTEIPGREWEAIHLVTGITRRAPLPHRAAEILAATFSNTPPFCSR